MEAMTARLCSEVLPDVPLRQWTVSFPFALRRLLAADAKLLSAVHRSFVRLVLATMRASAPVPRGRCGAVSFLQRFDSSLGLDPHVHLCAVDGVYTQRPDGTLAFHDTGPPSSEEVEAVAVRLHGSIRRLLTRRGLLTRDGELAPRESDVTTPLERLYEAAARDFVASGTLDADGRPVVRRAPRAGVQHLGPRLVDVDGVNIHADLRVEAGDRDGRARLVRYALRPPFAHAQLSETTDGRIAFELRKPRRNGDTHRFFTPAAFLRRLAWLVVPPRQALVRYAGVLGPAARWRSRVVPTPPRADEDPLPRAMPLSGEVASAPSTAAPRPRTRLSWPAMLRRVFQVDVLACEWPGCGGRMRILCAITSPAVIRRILEHLDLPSDLPAFAPARGPPATFDFTG
jgi:hypothetical protein